jgi:hypothetical protein
MCAALDVPFIRLTGATFSGSVGSGFAAGEAEDGQTQENLLGSH